MRICYLANAESIHIQRWVNYLAGKGHEVHVLSPNPGEGYIQGVQIHQLTVPLPQKLWAALRSINVMVRIIKVKRLINKIEPDILDAHYISAYGWLAITSGFHPVVLTPWGSDILITPKQSFWLRSLVKYALKRAEMVICDSETVREGLLELGANPTRIRIIYNGIDTQQFSPQPDNQFKNRLGLHGVPVILSTRNLELVYNVEMLIRAIPLILEQASQARFIIIGDGKQREYLEELATSLGISENISFVGWIPHDELPGYLNSSDIYVSTSRSDSTSMSLQEAMACELAPVVTDLPANREWINDAENGFIVPIDNPQALAERIIYLIENKETRERFGKNSRKIIKERAEYEKEMDKVEELYQGLISSQKSSRKKLTA